MTTLLFASMTLAMILAGVRVLIGPSLADRVVALDLVAVAAVGMLIACSIHFDQPSFLDIAIGLALVSFVGTVAFASYLERRASQPTREVQQ